MSGTLIIGGAYFSDARLNFLRKYEGVIIEPKWEHVCNCEPMARVPDDWFFIFGLKKWVRRLKKAGVKYGEIPKVIYRWIDKNIGDRPMGILDDCNLDDELAIGDGLRRRVFAGCDCRVYLLREYLRRKMYDSRVVPFSIPAPDNTSLIVDNKTTSVFFHGNDSHKDRSRYIKEFKHLEIPQSKYVLYKHGEKSPEKVNRDSFLGMMASSEICLSFAGAGYCCFRHQEIPSVGSVCASPKDPLVMRNGYVNGESCIRFDKASEVLPYLKDKVRLKEMAEKAHIHFRKYHTVGVRYREFMEYLGEVCRDLIMQRKARSTQAKRYYR